MKEPLEMAAIALFEGLRARFPSLRIDINPDDPNVEVSAEILRQPGLAFDVCLNLQNRDELHLAAGDDFWCSWFPADDAEVVTRFRDTVVGVLSGEYRIVEYRVWGYLIGTALEAPAAQGWRRVASSGIALASLRWGKASKVLQNEAPSNNGMKLTKPGDL